MKCIRFSTSVCLRNGEENSRWCHNRSLDITSIINLRAVDGADNKELQKNRFAESEKEKRRSRTGNAWIIHLPHNQRYLPYLWARSPHGSAGIVLCLLWNAIAIHSILNDSEVSPAHTQNHSTQSGPVLLQVLFHLMLSCAVTRVKITVAVTRASVITYFWAQLTFHDNSPQWRVFIIWGQ